MPVTQTRHGNRYESRKHNSILSRNNQHSNN